MASKFLEATPLQIEKIYPDTVLITQLEGHRILASTIAGAWDERGQNIHCRSFVVNAIRSRYGEVERVTIALDGTPVRGLALVKLCGRERALRTGDESQVLGVSQTRLLQQFANQVYRAVWMRQNDGSAVPE